MCGVGDQIKGGVFLVENFKKFSKSHENFTKQSKHNETILFYVKLCVSGVWWCGGYRGGIKFFNSILLYIYYVYKYILCTIYAHFLVFIHYIMYIIHCI